MTLPTYPATGAAVASDWGDWVHGASAASGLVWVDSFAGASDDARLTAAMTAVAAETYPRGIAHSNRLYTYNTTSRVPFEGMRIVGPRGYSNPERGGGHHAWEARLTGSGPWFAAGSQTFSVTFENMVLNGNNNSNVYFLSGNYYCLAIHNLYSSGMKSVFGTLTDKLLITASSWWGDFEMNNAYDCQLHVGGSDNRLFMDGGLIDSGAGYGGSGNAHMWFDGTDKTRVGALYFTAEADWSAIRVSGNAADTTGNNQGGPVVFTGCTIEGRNESQPCYGSLVRVEGGVAKFRDCDFNFAMSSPATMGHTPADAGVLMHTGGKLEVLGANYDRATGVAATVPFVYTTGPSSLAKVTVEDVTTTARGGTWTSNLPIFQKLTAGTENRRFDTTTTQNTA